METAKKVFPYVFVGVGIGAFIHNWIPKELIVKVLGKGALLAIFIGIYRGNSEKTKGLELQ